MRMPQTQHGRLKSNADASNPTRMPQTQRGTSNPMWHLKPNAASWTQHGTLNPTQRLSTQHGHLEPNADMSSQTPNELRQPRTCQVEHWRIEPTRMCRTWPGGGGLNDDMRFMDHRECRVGQYFVYDVCCRVVYNAIYIDSSTSQCGYLRVYLWVPMRICHWKYLRVLVDPWVFDSWLWVIRGKESSQIWVQNLAPKYPWVRIWVTHECTRAQPYAF